MAFQLFSTAFADGGWIPALHSCDGADLSPALEWSGEPGGTHSFALIVDDPYAPAGAWNHWLLWDVPAKTHNLPQGFKPGIAGVSGRNDFGRSGYGGPCPPKGHGPHRYFFKLYALDTKLNLKAGTNKKAVETAMQGHILARGEYMGRYSR